MSEGLRLTVESVFQGEDDTVVEFSDLGSERGVVLNTVAFTFTANVNNDQGLGSSIEPVIHNEVSLSPSAVIERSIMVKLLVEVIFSLVFILDLVLKLCRSNSKENE